jgi:PAS domain S-box-containing protein
MTRNSRSPRVAADIDRAAFQRCPVPLWEEDITGLREFLRERAARMKPDMTAYFRAHPALVAKGLRSIRIVNANDAAMELSEARSRAELLGSTPWMAAPESTGAVVDLFRAVAEGRAALEQEYSAQTLTGRKLHVLVRTSIPHEGEAHPIMLVTMIDVTRLLEREQTLARAIIDSVPDQMFVKDLDGKFLLANRQLARWAGKASPSELTGKTDYDFFPKETADSFRADDREICAGGNARIDFEEEIVSGDGKRAWASTSKIPFRSPSGEVAGIIGVVRDITHRKALERKISEEKALMRAVVDNIPDPIFVKDPHGRFLLANGAAAEVMQAKGPEDLLGRTDADFYPPEVAREFASDEQAVVHDGRKLINKVEPRTVRGVERWILTTKVPLRGADGGTTGLVGISRDISSLKEAQDALAKSEERYRLLVEDIGVGILSADSEGTITFTNSAAEEILGVPRGASLGRKAQEFLPPEELQKLTNAIGGRDRADRSLYEISIVRADGQIRRLLISAVSRFDAEGRYTGLFSTMQDVTDRYKAETELARQKVFIQALMDNVPDYIYFKDRESRFILNNKAHARELGAGSPVEMTGKTDFDFFGEEHARKAFTDEQRIIATGVPLINEVEKETWPDRPPSWVSSTKMPLRDETGEIIGTFGVSRDMTERRRMEEKNMRLVAMIESSSDAIIGIGLEDTVTSWNKGAEAVFGYTAEEMIGQPITPLLSPLKMTTEATLQEELVREGQVLRMESEVTRKDGKRIQVSTSISVIKDQDGRIIGTTCITRDVTDQKALQVQIIRAQRLESLGTLAAGIAHQFNNINAAVRGYLDYLAQDAGVPSNAQAYIRETIKAIQRATDITDRLQGLTMSAPTASLEEVNLEEAVLALTALFTEVLENEGIRLAVDMPQTPPVRISRSYLEFLVTSLMTNSIHALIGCASPSITVRGGRQAGFCSLEVSDNGCGISPENLPRVFTPFFTTKGEWAEPGSPQAGVKGIGLSLAVCQGTIAESGGWIEVESPPQGRTVFRAWIPTASRETEE